MENVKELTDPEISQQVTDIATKIAKVAIDAWYNDNVFDGVLDVSRERAIAAVREKLIGMLSVILAKTDPK